MKLSDLWKCGKKKKDKKKKPNGYYTHNPPAGFKKAEDKSGAAMKFPSIFE